MTNRKSKQEGVDASNRDYLAYEGVEKRQDYRFAEAEGEERFDEETVIRTCDMSAFLAGDALARDAFAEELGQALRDIGFAILTGHGIDVALHDETAENVERLFAETPLERKLELAARRIGSVNQGYFPIEETSDIHPDLVEGWVFCRRAFDLGEDECADWTSFWPDPADEAQFRRHCLAHEALILPIMQSILRFLGCDPHLYDARLTRTNIGLRLNHYPPIEGASRAGRLLGHEDVDLFTLLPAPRIEGLQVMNRENDAWIRLDAPPGSIILNTGDYMQRITNDVLPSTTHRVSQPRDPDARRRSRVSFPLNVYLREEEELAVLPGVAPPPRYEPISALKFHTGITAKYYGDDHAVE